MTTNRQRTDPQKIEVQQRRNALTKRIKVWRVAQMVYMPQVSAYLPNEGDSVDPEDDAQGLDISKPETWPLFLPSAIPRDDRSACYRGVIETEQVLRLAQLQDGLVGLRLSRRALRNLRLYFKTNMAGEGKNSCGGQDFQKNSEKHVISLLLQCWQRFWWGFSSSTPVTRCFSVGGWENLIPIPGDQPRRPRG